MKLNFTVDIDPIMIKAFFASMREGVTMRGEPEKEATPPAEAPKACVACGGSGLNSKGEPCVCAKKRRGRPSKTEAAPAPALPAEHEEVDTSKPPKAEPAPQPAGDDDFGSAPTPAPLPSAPPKLAVPERDLVVIACSGYKNKHGREAVVALLKKYGGETSVGSVPEKNWAALLAEAKAGV